MTSARPPTLAARVRAHWLKWEQESIAREKAAPPNVHHARASVGACVRRDLAEIRDAARLLRDWGYRVIPPSRQ